MFFKYFFIKTFLSRKCNQFLRAINLYLFIKNFVFSKKKLNTDGQLKSSLVPQHKFL